MEESKLKELTEALEERTVLSATVSKEVSAGYLVRIPGLPAFLPYKEANQSEPLPPGEKIDVCIIRLPEDKHLTVVSSKAAAQVRANALAKKYSVGDIVHVRVMNLASYGVFCQIEEGLPGLIYYKELTYSRNQSDIQNVSVGDEFDAKIITIQERKGDLFIALSRRELLPNPWETLSLSVGDVFEGRVNRKSPYGFFVSTPEQFDVLLHRTRLGSTKQGNRELMQTIDVGDMLTVRVEEVDREAEKIVISLVSVKEKHIED